MRIFQRIFYSGVDSSIVTKRLPSLGRRCLACVFLPPLLSNVLLTCVSTCKTEKNISSGDLIISELAENCFNLIIPIRISATWRFSLTGLSLKKNSLATSAAYQKVQVFKSLKPLFHRISSNI